MQLRIPLLTPALVFDIVCSMGYWSTTEDRSQRSYLRDHYLVDYLKAQIALLEHQIATLRAENQSLCNQIRRLGARPLGGYLNMRGKR